MSSASPNNPYAYPKPSSLATRTLVADQNEHKPEEVPSVSSHDEVAAAATATAQDKPPLQRRSTNHYAEACEAASSTSPTDDTVRPSLDRQQSWKMQDLKREHAEKMLSGHMPGGSSGYTSTQT